MSAQFDRLVEVIARLRGPDGCPWDREQTHHSLLTCLLDEAYEFFEAVEDGDPEHMREELGDLLMQVVLHAQLASETKAFTIDDVAEQIADKLVRRHPHVFSDAHVKDSADVVRNWEELKRQEADKQSRRYFVDGIPRSLPALFRAEKVQRRVARVGFDWTDMKPVLDKVEEEFAEFRQALESGDMRHAEEELGDILFALVNVARHRGLCAEEALRGTVHKFMRRFRFIEDEIARRGQKLGEVSLDEMDQVWERSKAEVG